MPHFWKAIVIFCMAFLSACSTIAGNHVFLKDILENPRVITVPFQMQESGLILLEGVVVGEQSMTLLLDTGATRSAIFQKTFDGLEVDLSIDRTVNIHGMSNVVRRDVTIIPSLNMGGVEFANVDFVILPDRAKNNLLRQSQTPMDGLIGMDVLSDYTLYLSRRGAELKLIPKDIVVRAPRNWSKIALTENPFIDDDRGLHFFTVDMLNDDIPTLFDSGAEINVMSWNDLRHRKLKTLYKTLRQDWEIQGAVGSFRPIGKVRLDFIRAGDVTWEEKDIIFMELGSLDILGADDSSFLVAGFNLIDNDEVLIDFERNVLSVTTKRNREVGPSLRALGEAQTF